METVKSSDSRFASVAIASGVCLLLGGVGAGLLTRILSLSEPVTDVVRFAGLASVLVGALVACFGALVRQQAKSSTRWRKEAWRLAPIVCFAYGVMFGNAFFGKSFPVSGIGLFVGLVFWWSAWRRRGAA